MNKSPIVHPNEPSPEEVIMDDLRSWLVERDLSLFAQGEVFVLAKQQGSKFVLLAEIAKITKEEYFYRPRNWAKALEAKQKK